MNETVLNGIFALVGVVLGWVLNGCSESRRRKPKLCYGLKSTIDQNELTPIENRTKTSESGYGIEIYNNGQEPVFIRHVSLYYKKAVIVDYLMLNRLIMPHEMVVYEMAMQDYDALRRWQSKYNLKCCKIFAYDVAGKRIKGSIDLWNGLFPFDGN